MLPGSASHPSEVVARRATIPFILVHLIPLFALLTGVSRRALVLGAVLYVVRAFFITAGYHRYFAHRSFRTSRVTQAVLAFGGGTAAQKGALWWAANHRAHHRHTDTDLDPHSPQRGFWWSHVGWILSDRYSSTDYDEIEDFAKYPELRFLNKHDWIAPWSLGVFSFIIAGWSGLVVGFFGSTILLWHATFFVNSLAHLRGRRRYATNDSSRNNTLIAIATLGEGWHNNHHHHPRSARQGLRWWEFDPTYTVLKVMQRAHVVHDLQLAPPAVVQARRLGQGSHDVGLIRYHLSRAAKVASGAANPEHMVGLIESASQQIVTAARRPGAPSTPDDRSSLTGPPAGVS